ncbi:hypothetical protein D6851_05150 [Altericroceibacterium spongiae]|uniref:Uncharacterized protein n=1 Tax=Altericroceibacterium spongiae TaxID=2320269 RepID=A0A420EPK1_9SPHN|nr:hypothetical protein [Altericroceibacterium spongiae]RKF22606.1 hypothetical protein D6851_05150 [Altericroceibacterium spongiae]
MTRHFLPPNLDDAAHRSLLVEAARCWRNARDTGQSVQPCLYKILASHNCEMLVPVFDSLMHLCEDALGRAVAIGEDAALSGDEHLLLGLIDGSKPRRTCIDCAEGAASALDCAICSTRIMMGLALVRDTGDIHSRAMPKQSVPPVMN